MKPLDGESSGTGGETPTQYYVRTLHGSDELISAAKVFRTAMVGLPAIAPIDEAFVSQIYEQGRTFGAFEGERLIGTTDSYSSFLTVPGGLKIKQAAVTHVGVLPTHKRRGVATALFADQLKDAASRGEIVANLRASDARIYGNFGYGIATSAASFELATEGARLRGNRTGKGKARLVDTQEALSRLPAIYGNLKNRHPGTIARPIFWWRLQQLRHNSANPAYVAISGDEGRETGFVRYHPLGLDEWFSGKERSIVVDDLVADDADAYGALIEHLLSIDLIHRIVFANRPLDDALPWLFENHRQVKVTAVRDETWLRLLDVHAGLAARTYVSDAAVGLEVVDPLLPENNATFRISAKGVERTDDAPDVRADIATLSAAYLGGTHWWQLSQAGRVSTSRDDAITHLDALFAVPAAPHSGTIF